MTRVILLMASLSAVVLLRACVEEAKDAANAGASTVAPRTPPRHTAVTAPEAPDAAPEGEPAGAEPRGTSSSPSAAPSGSAASAPARQDPRLPNGVGTPPGGTSGSRTPPVIIPDDIASEDPDLDGGLLAEAEEPVEGDGEA